MSDQERMEEQTASKEDSFDRHLKKKKRYQGYDIDKITSKNHKLNRPWFWKVLFLSLFLSLIIIAGACLHFIKGDLEKTDYLTGMNEANTMSALLKGHKNVTITESFSHVTDEKDYTQSRQVTRTKNGEYYSYLKKEQGEDKFKEVIRDRKVYRYDESFARYVALIDDDYEKVCVPQIEGCVYQNQGDEQIEDQKDKGNLVNIKAGVIVKEGDKYNRTFGFEPGSRIEKTIVMDKESGIVTSETESCNDEEFYSYLVEYDGETKTPKFFIRIKQKEDSRKCTVYMDYGAEDSRALTYDVPFDVYFTVLDRKGYKCYTDTDCKKEFSEYQIQIQNPEGPISLYMKKE